MQDTELIELRKTIEALRQQSIDAGLTVACLQSTSHDITNKLPPTSPTHSKPPPHPQHPNSNNASCTALHAYVGRSHSSPGEKGNLDYARRHTFTGNCRDLVVREMSTQDGEDISLCFLVIPTTRSFGNTNFFFYSFLEEKIISDSIYWLFLIYFAKKESSSNLILF